MDKKTKIFFLVLALLITYSIVTTYCRTFIARDYIIIAEIECDPSIEKCFIYTCDPEFNGECPADEAEWTSYYKLIKKKEANIPPEIDSCDPNVSDCPELSCDSGEADCQIIECDPENLGEGEECSLPEEYNMDNPEEAMECTGGDESCIQEEIAICSEDDESCVQEETEACPEGDESCIQEDSVQEQPADQSAE